MRAKMRMSFRYTHFVIKSNHHVKSEIEEIMLIWGLQREQQHILGLILVTGLFRLSWDRKKVFTMLQVLKSGRSNSGNRSKSSPQAVPN